MSRYSKEIEEIRIMDQQQAKQQPMGMLLQQQQQHPLLFQHHQAFSSVGASSPANNHNASSASSPLTATTQVSSQNSQLLHFHQPAATLHHQQPHQQQQQQQHQMHQLLQNNHLYSTLHHQQQQANTANHHHQSRSQHSSHSSGSQTMPFLQHLQQQQQQQQQYGNSQQQQTSSDYSSSTYHVYDQILGDQIIDDLIVIKQERMKKKLEQEHKRKVILFSCALILLVGLLLFLLVQLFKASASTLSSSSSVVLRASEQQQQQQQQYAQMRPNWAPPLGAQNNQLQQTRLATSSDYFDASRFQQQPELKRVLLQQQVCSGRGQLVQLAEGQTCRCEPGFFGDQCQDLVKCTQFGPYFCNNNGHCDRLTGRCNCLAGFVGAQCEFRQQQQQQTTFPALQQQKQQQQQQQQQQVDDASICATLLNNCNGNGQCLANRARCQCLPGFVGDTCEMRLTTTGATSAEQMLQANLNCSFHGHYEQALRKCICDFGFSGLDCSEIAAPALGPPRETANNQQQQQAQENANRALSSLDCEFAPAANQSSIDCGQYGAFNCHEQRCVCQDGYTGELCRVARCSARCLRNGGLCSPDGHCSCPSGRYGRHCTFDGCPNACSGRGQCVQQVGALADGPPEWRCQCQPGAAGDDCGQSTERQCDDGQDNDQDGLVDCADSECCSDKVCQNSTLCMKSPDPLDILMRKQPPPPTSSFFQRMQFLIEKFSSQIYSNPKDFNDSRASVIRGRVTYLKQPVTGVRVSVAGQINLGITLTRDSGHFDLMVNGGGAVVLEFRREPFATLQRTVRVPWNEIVLVDPVELELEISGQQQETSGNSSSSSTTSTQQAERPIICSAHNYRLMKPQIIAAGSRRQARGQQQTTASTAAAIQSKSQQASNKIQRAVILRDSALVQQTIVLPNSSSGAPGQEQQQQQQVSLVYISSKANEFMSTVTVQLIPQLASKLPDELKLVHLRISIEGNLFEQQFEPQQNLSFTYAWNRRNVYKQKSFGLSTALVSVGYEYFDCQRPIWCSKQLQLAGHDLSISDIGNQWNLNIHHRFNHRDSILQRGDGQNFNLRAERPLVVQPQMGDGYQRAPMCPYCDGQSAQPSEHRLLRPQALLSAPDNSLYVGDHNLIRRMEPASWSVAQSARGERVVRTVLELASDRQQQQALKYSLALSSAPETRLYLADQERAQVFYVRERQEANESLSSASIQSESFATSSGSTTLDSSLVPVVGSGAKCQLGDQLPVRDNCGDSGPARLARLVEPRALVFDLANRMYIADGPNVRLVEPSDQKIYTLLGDYSATPRNLAARFPCAQGETVPMHKFAPRAPQSLALSPIDDTLHLLDDNVVYKITQDKRVQLVAGRPAHCTGGATTQQKASKASEFAFQAAHSIAFNPNGHLLVAEDEPRLGLARVFLVEPEEDLVYLYAGAGSPSSSSSSSSTEAAEQQQQQQQQQEGAKLRSSNALPSNQAARASEHRFASIGAIAVDQRGNLLVADRQQPRVVSIEPDLPQMNAAGEYELQSPDNHYELLVFNRFGHHVATRELAPGAIGSQSSGSVAPASSQRNKYTFSYNVNTSFGQLASVQLANGNKLSIYRDGPHHSVKMIESAFGGQCRLDISRQGQVHSIAISSSSSSSSSSGQSSSGAGPSNGLQAGPSTKINLTYQIDGGLLRQSRDQNTGEVHEFAYDEFGRAQAISLSSPRLPAPVECRLQLAGMYAARKLQSSYIGRECNALIVPE